MASFKNDSMGQRFAAAIGNNARFFLLLLAAMIVAVVQVLLAAYKPSLFTPVFQSLCTTFQLFASIFAGIAWSKQQAEKEANARWLPVAASSCHRLLTLMSSVRNLRGTVGKACGVAKQSLPELNREMNRAIRIHIEDLCAANATRLA